MFNMAHMGLRLAQRANGVSRLHGAVSRGMFGGLWAGFDADEVPIGSVTNGVHGHTWEAREVTALIGEPGRRQPGRAVSGRALWELRNALRARLVDEVRRRVREAWLQRGASTPELGWTDHVFDPDVLTVGFARRVPTYKRLTPDAARQGAGCATCCSTRNRPVQLVVAGKSHPADDGGKALIQEIVRFADDPAVRHRIVFLPDYDMSMARYLYWGCDVWLNNPLRPLEACGTSGMKSALNGGLNLSIRDGWWDELYDGAQRLGHPHRRRHRGPGPARRPGGQRALRAAGHPGGAGVLRPRRRRRADPLGGAGPPHPRHAAPAGAGHPDGARVRRGLVRARGARGRAPWSPTATRAPRSSPPTGPGWRGRGRGSQVHRRRRLGAAGHPGRRGADDGAGRGRPRRARPGRRRGAGRRRAGRRRPTSCADTGAVSMQHVGQADGPAKRFEAVVPLPLAGLTGYTVRVLPRHPLLASPAELGKVVLA